MGSFPSAYLVTRAQTGVDIREIGSHNLGAMNVFYKVGFVEGMIVLLADIGNAGCGIGSVIDLDAFQPDWQRTTGPPSFVGMCGRNMACIGQTPDGTYGVGLWVSANAAVDPTGFLQIGRDQVGPVLDYAQHIACFKMGGAEFDQTAGLYQNMISVAKLQNARLNAVAFYRGQLEQPASKSELQVNRLAV